MIGPLEVVLIGAVLYGLFRLVKYFIDYARRP